MTDKVVDFQPGVTHPYDGVKTTPDPKPFNALERGASSAAKDTVVIDNGAIVSVTDTATDTKAEEARLEEAEKEAAVREESARVDRSITATMEAIDKKNEAYRPAIQARVTELEEQVRLREQQADKLIQQERQRAAMQSKQAALNAAVQEQKKAAARQEAETATRLVDEAAAEAARRREELEKKKGADLARVLYDPQTITKISEVLGPVVNAEIASGPRGLFGRPTLKNDEAQARAARAIQLSGLHGDLYGSTEFATQIQIQKAKSLPSADVNIAMGPIHKAAVMIKGAIEHRQIRNYHTMHANPEDEAFAEGWDSIVQAAPPDHKLPWYAQDLNQPPTTRK